MEEAIKAVKLVKKFGDVKALNGLDLSVRKGVFYGLLGPNGSGKTTTVRILSGQIKPTSGKAYVLGIDVSNYIKVRENIGLVPEEEYPPSFLTPLEYLKFVCKVRKIENPEEKINFWLEFLDFENYKNVLVKDLSRGTKQKLMLAQAFIHEPKVIFLDEPFINIDPIIQRKFKKFIRDYVEKGNTILFCTHILSLAKEVCDEVGIMKDGRIVKEVKAKSCEKEFFKVFKDVGTP